MYKNIWNLCNIVTFIGVALTMLGIYLGFHGQIMYSIILMIFIGICDGFDGTFAKIISKKNKRENIYGIELDSLADIVCSGIYPIIIYYAMGYNGIINTIIYVFFIICGITRLAYFNVNVNEKEFTGIPITMSTMIIPLIYVITQNEYVHMGLLVLLGIAYTSNVKVKKMNLKEKILLSIIGVFITIYIFVLGG